MNKPGLRAATSLLHKTDKTGKELPTQGDVEDYLDIAPGQAATITGFTNFLNRQQGTTLKPVVNTPQAKKKRKEKLAKSLMKMAQHPEKDETWQWKWLVLGLEYFHDRKISRKAIHQQEIETKDDGIWVILEGKRYWLPSTHRDL